jgi:CIC family chloride channel protein
MVEGNASEGEPRTRRSLGALPFYLVAVLVGLAAGVGAAGFRAMIALFHNLLFLGEISWTYDANLHTPESPWGPLVIAVPVAGAMVVAHLVERFAPEARGHGVPEVVDAIHFNRGRIRPIVAVIKSLASALSIGSGGSVGREGPIIQIGSAFGSTLGQLCRLPRWQSVTLIAAGAGGGIAATFNTPVGGVLFAVEIVMQEVSARTLVPVAIATATATYLGRLFFGPHPSFVIPALESPYFHATNPSVLVLYVGLGLLLGLVSVAYIRSIYAFEEFFEHHVPGGYVVRHMIGMTAVGVLLYGLWLTTGHYFVAGVGYATVQDILEGGLSGVPFLCLLFGLKLLATSLTLGSGASGGVFSPGLFMGATLGAAYAELAARLLPSIPVSTPAFAVAGMAGTIGGATGAALAAIVMIFEMTLDYSVIVPMTITTALAYGVRRALCPSSIYGMKLERRGRLVPDALRASPHELFRAGDVMNTHGTCLPASCSIEEAAHLLTERGEIAWLLVVSGEHVLGALTRADAMVALGEHGGQMPVSDRISSAVVRVDVDASLPGVLGALSRRRASVALVTERGQRLTPKTVRGIVTRTEISDTLLTATAAFDD